MKFNDLLSLVVLGAACALARDILDPAGAEARRALTDRKLAAFVEECSAA